MELMSARDYENYRNMFQSIVQYIRPPDLLIYLRASVPTLIRNIQKRGREYEAAIRSDYLSKLNGKYEKWIGEYVDGKLLVVDMDSMNFADRPEHLGEIIRNVEAKGVRKRTK